MFQKHLGTALPALADGRLPPAEAMRARAHVGRCERCRAALDEYQYAARMVEKLTLVEAPASIWTSIEMALASAEHTADDDRLPGSGALFRRVPARQLCFALAAIVVLAVTGILFWQINRSAAHDVGRLDASGGAGRMTIGEWIETDGASSARLRIGEIGTVDVAPETRMQLLAAKSGEHRLKLVRGLISVEIAAPPRLFFVETASSTVVDLGCAYTMEVDQTGVGRLRVTSGWASLEWGKLEALVPAGASGPTRPDLGPGTPSFDDASERLREALLYFDYGGGGSRAIDVVLAESRQRDTLTLWHLLSRVDAAQRSRVFDRMVALTPLPGGVTRENVLALDAATLTRWREELAWTW